jgi:hypothetical protein
MIKDNKGAKLLYAQLDISEYFYFTSTHLGKKLHLSVGETPCSSYMHFETCHVLIL